MTLRAIRQALLAILTLAAVVALAGYRGARADPVVRAATVVLPDWPAGAPPVRAVLVSDIHLGSSVMDTARLARIVAQVERLRPDVVLLAGDFIAGHSPANAASAAPGLAVLSRLRAPLGTIAVLGNHDHWTDAKSVRRRMAAAGVTVLDNAAVARGPLAIAGIDDLVTHHNRLNPTIAALRKLKGARILLSHSPDATAALPGDIPLELAGHTHCGQIVLPLIGAPTVPSHFGARYMCGIVKEGRRTTIVSGGVGTSVVPIRIGAPPDLWLVMLKGADPAK